MIRSAYTAVLAAAFGALAIAPFREAVADQLWQPGEAIAVALTALAAGAIALFAMAMREPVKAGDDAALIVLKRAREILPPGQYACLVGDYSKVNFEDVKFVGGHQPVSSGGDRPTPPTSGSGIQPRRDGHGRFAKAS